MDLDKIVERAERYNGRRANRAAINRAFRAVQRYMNESGDDLAGLEYALDDDLEGTAGSMIYDSSTYGTIPLGTSISEPAVDGASYELTIDSDLQWMVEQFLAEGMDQAGAKTGMASH